MRRKKNNIMGHHYLAEIAAIWYRVLCKCYDSHVLLFLLPWINWLGKYQCGTDKIIKIFFKLLILYFAGSALLGLHYKGIT